MASFKVLSSIVLALSLVLLAAPGCAEQGEGERCDKDRAGDADCESGLVCVKADQLTDPSTDRCCPSEGESYSDSRCARGGTIPTFDGGTDSSGGGAGGEPNGAGGA